MLSRYYHNQRQADSRSAARTTLRLLESLIRLAQAHARLMARKEVTIQDAIVAVTCVECSMQKTALLGSMNALHTKFPDDPEEEYKLQAELILKRLGLNGLLDKVFSLPNTARDPGDEGERGEDEERETRGLDHVSTGNGNSGRGENDVNESPGRGVEEHEEDRSRDSHDDGRNDEDVSCNSQSAHQVIIEDKSRGQDKIDDSSASQSRDTEELMSRDKRSNIEESAVDNDDSESSPTPGTITSQAFDIEQFSPDKGLENESTNSEDLGVETSGLSSSEQEDNESQNTDVKSIEDNKIGNSNEKGSASVSSVSRLAQFAFKNTRDSSNDKEGSSRIRESQILPPQMSTRRDQEAKGDTDDLGQKESTQNESEKNKTKKCSPQNNNIINLFRKPGAQRSSQLSTQLSSVSPSAPNTPLPQAKIISDKANTVVEIVPIITPSIFSTDELSDEELEVDWPSDFLSKVSKANISAVGNERMLGKGKREVSEEDEEPSKKKRKEK